jgi:hypothetical protein
MGSSHPPGLIACRRSENDRGGLTVFLILCEEGRFRREQMETGDGPGNVSGGSVTLSAATVSGKDPGETRNGYIFPLDATIIKNLRFRVKNIGGIFFAAANQNRREQNTPHNKNV